ncbi:hypothetical protein Acal01_00759 [Acinetobacter calcoaceticus]|jgi:hypothetical protein
MDSLNKQDKKRINEVAYKIHKVWREKLGLGNCYKSLQLVTTERNIYLKYFGWKGLPKLYKWLYLFF